MSLSDTLVDALLTRHGLAAHHAEGDLYITEPCVCKSHAGHYVGTWCIEVISGMWVPQPYSRDSGYMTAAMAAEFLEYEDRA